MIPRIKNVVPLAGYRLSVEFDGGRKCVYDMADDISEIPDFKVLTTTPGLFESVALDSSRTCLVWSDRIDLPSDTVYEYAKDV